jgi:hypothetical protein
VTDLNHAVTIVRTALAQGPVGPRELEDLARSENVSHIDYRRALRALNVAMVTRTSKGRVVGWEMRLPAEVDV